MATFEPGASARISSSRPRRPRQVRTALEGGARFGLVVQGILYGVGSQPYGTLLLGAAALGLVAFCVHALVMAGRRDVVGGPRFRRGGGREQG